MKLLICSAHSCIHHHMYPNTEKDMDQRGSRLLQHDDAHLVAHQPTVTSIPSSIHRTHANMSLVWRGRSPLSIDVFIIIRHTGGGERDTITTTTEDDNEQHPPPPTLCPKSTWTQIKWSQIHLNVLISTKFPYIASTPTCKAQL